jgi:hypothetical protein
MMQVLGQEFYLLFECLADGCRRGDGSLRFAFDVFLSTPGPLHGAVEKSDHRLVCFERSEGAALPARSRNCCEWACNCAMVT